MRLHTGHVLIQAHRDKVFDYVADYENCPKWAKNFILGLRKTGKGCIVKTPMGEQTLEIVGDRNTGVIDHILDGKILPSRVLGMGPYTLFAFTIILPPDVPEADFRRGVQGLEEELQLLKEQVERL